MVRVKATLANIPSFRLEYQDESTIVLWVLEISNYVHKVNKVYRKANVFASFDDSTPTWRLPTSSSS